MNPVNIHFAKTHLSQLIEKAAGGEPFIIAKAGKPMVKVISIDAPAPGKINRFGFLKGQAKVPSQKVFNELGADEIANMFSGGE